MKNLIDFFIAVKLLLPQPLTFTISLLEFLQPEPHIINIGFIRFLIGEIGLEGIPETPTLWQSIDSAD